MGFRSSIFAASRSAVTAQSWNCTGEHSRRASVRSRKLHAMPTVCALSSKDSPILQNHSVIFARVEGQPGAPCAALAATGTAGT